MLPFALAACLVLATPPAAATLVASARVPGTRILLRDLVAEDARAALSADLLDLDLGRAPCPGYARTFSRDAIYDLVPHDRLRILGPDAITIESDARTVSPDEIAAAARKFIDDSMKLADGTEVALERPPLEVRVPRGREGVVLLARLSGRAVDRGPLAMCVDVRVDGALQAVVPVSFRARTFGEMPVLARDVQAGEALTPDCVTSARVETTDLARIPAPLPPFGDVAKIALAKGRAVKVVDFEHAVLVRRNDAVTLRFTRGRLTAETFGIARDAGIKGAPVRVENLLTKKIVTGRVESTGLVVVGP